MCTLWCTDGKPCGNSEEMITTVLQKSDRQCVFFGVTCALKCREGSNVSEFGTGFNNSNYWYCTVGHHKVGPGDTAAPHVAVVISIGWAL